MKTYNNYCSKVTKTIKSLVDILKLVGIILVIFIFLFCVSAFFVFGLSFLMVITFGEPLFSEAFRFIASSILPFPQFMILIILFWCDDKKIPFRHSWAMFGSEIECNLDDIARKHGSEATASVVDKWIEENTVGIRHNDVAYFLFKKDAMKYKLVWG